MPSSEQTAPGPLWYKKITKKPAPRRSKMAIPDPPKAGSPFCALWTGGWNPKTPKINNFFIPEGEPGGRVVGFVTSPPARRISGRGVVRWNSRPTLVPVLCVPKFCRVFQTAAAKRPKRRPRRRLSGHFRLSMLRNLVGYPCDQTGSQPPLQLSHERLKGGNRKLFTGRPRRG